MEGDWRIALYPLGWISAFAFGSRFLIQWLASEKAGRTLTPRLFWQLSLLGNLSLAFHSWIQLQYPVCLVQSINAVISWRNLNPYKSRWLVVFLLFLAVGLSTTLFWQQGGEWMRIPIHSYQQELLTFSLQWHLVGALGTFLFALRFWIQWFEVEKYGNTELQPIFWWISIAGALLSLIYFISIYDPVNAIGPLFGMIPFIRNLMLSRKET